MNKIIIFFTVLAMGFATMVSADDATVKKMLALYESQGGKNFSASTGKAMWSKEFSVKGEKRSCVTCHTADLKSKGKRADTGKVIDPMSPQVNSQRYNDPKFIEKWFKRNCKWTMDRECTAQEKGDYLLYLSQN